MPKKQQTAKTKRRTRVKDLAGDQKKLSKGEQKKVKGGQKLADSQALASKLRAPGEW